MDTEAQRPTSVSQRVYPRHEELLPREPIRGGRYLVRYADSREDLRAIQRLRFEVFNLELEEGLDESFSSGLDQDEFDLHCHHLIVQTAKDERVIGTYRLQTLDTARQGAGFYTAGEFDISGLPEDFLAQAVEAGRACIDVEHRNTRVLSLLWKGLAQYLIKNRKRYLFGCCSLPSTDPNLAKQVLDFLVRGKFVHTQWPTRPLPDFACFGADFEADINTSIKLPPLFASYLKIGGKITGRPALDRRFKTIDFLLILDVLDLDPHTYRAYFS